MICFEVTLNGQRLATAGLPGSGVLNTIVDLIEPSAPTKPQKLMLSVGGLDSSDPAKDGEHVRWVEHRPLSVGDTVTVQILARNSFDPPVRRRDAMTDEELKEDRSKSAHYYLGHYKKQQTAIAKQIRKIENFLANEKKQKAKGQAKRKDSSKKPRRQSKARKG